MGYLLAIDPGSIKLGYCVFQFTANNLTPIEVATKYLTNANHDGREVTIYDRLRRATQLIESLASKYALDEVAIEEAFTGKNFQSSITLAVARGVILAPILQREIPISEYPAKTVKTTATGSGSATKEDIIHLMKLEFAKSGLVEDLKEDAADAMAIGKAHHILKHSSVIARVATAEKKGMPIEGKYRKSTGSPRRSSKSSKMNRNSMQAHLEARGLIK